MNVAAYKEISTAITFCQIDPWWQSSYRNFNRLKISPLLYWKFRRYDYILFYELDAFVFRDELDKWCQAGYDYIGAPWFDGFERCSNDSPFLGVGNGGFSLRRISAALRVLRSFAYLRKPQLMRRLSHNAGPPSSHAVMAMTDPGVLRVHRDNMSPGICPDMLPPLLLQKRLGQRPSIRKRRALDNLIAVAARGLVLGNNTFYPLNDFDGHEDLFWGLIARRNFNWFKVASFDEARKFSFECNPRKLFELNGNQLPFGCHSWQKYDPEFWAAHITQNLKPIFNSAIC